MNNTPTNQNENKQNNQPQTSKSLKTGNFSSLTRKMCFCAVMAAMYVVLDILASYLSAVFGGSIKISLSGLPVIIAAIFLNPLWGALTGFVGAFIGQLLSPYGLTATTLLWTMPAVIRGITIGLLFIAFKRSLNPIILSIQTVISSLLVTAANTFVMYADSKIFGYYSYVYVFGGIVPRVIIGVITAIVFALIVPPIINLLNKQLKF